MSSARRLEAVILFAHGSVPPKKDDWFAQMTKWLGGVAQVSPLTYSFAATGRAKKAPAPDELVAEHVQQIKQLAEVHPHAPIFLAGKSLGARVGLMAAKDMGKDLPANVRGAISFSFPLVSTDDGVAYSKAIRKSRLPLLFFVGSEDSHPGYAASKGAVRIYTKAAAAKYGPKGIRVNSVHPGFMPPMLNATNQAGRASKIAATPLRRLGEPVEVAYGVLFLASDEASFVTGTELVIDGGYIAQ